MKGEFSEIPILDISPLFAPGASAARAATVARLRDSLERIGFTYLAGHGIASELIEGVRELSRRFHALPLEEKMAIRINGFHRGYMPFSTSTIVTSTVANVTRPNQSESLMFMHEVDEANPHYGEPLQGPNQWPASLPELYPAVSQYMQELTALGRVMAGGLAEALDLPRDWFDPHFRDPTLFLRLLHYPEQKDEEALFGSAPHTDYGFITVLAQDDVGGLEVRNRHGDWIAAPPIEGTFVMNVGDILARWANGRFVSTPHRVKNLSKRDRYSQPFFFDPSMESVIACPTQVLREGEARKHPPVRYGDYLLERLNKNYDYRKAKVS